MQGPHTNHWATAFPNYYGYFYLKGKHYSEWADTPSCHMINSEYSNLSIIWVSSIWTPTVPIFLEFGCIIQVAIFTLQYPDKIIKDVIYPLSSKYERRFMVSLGVLQSSRKSKSTWRQIKVLDREVANIIS